MEIDAGNEIYLTRRTQKWCDAQTALKYLRNTMSHNLALTVYWFLRVACGYVTPTLAISYSSRRWALWSTAPVLWFTTQAEFISRINFHVTARLLLLFCWQSCFGTMFFNPRNV